MGENIGSFENFSTSTLEFELEIGGHKTDPDKSGLLAWMEEFNLVDGSELEIEDLYGERVRDWFLGMRFRCRVCRSSDMGIRCSKSNFTFCRMKVNSNRGDARPVPRFVISLP